MHYALEFQRNLSFIGAEKLAIRQQKGWEGKADNWNRIRLYNAALHKLIGDEMNADRLRDAERFERKATECSDGQRNSRPQDSSTGCSTVERSNTYSSSSTTDMDSPISYSEMRQTSARPFRRSQVG